MLFARARRTEAALGNSLRVHHCSKQSSFLSAELSYLHFFLNANKDHRLNPQAKSKKGSKGKSKKKDEPEKSKPKAKGKKVKSAELDNAAGAAEKQEKVSMKSTVKRVQKERKIKNQTLEVCSRQITLFKEEASRLSVEIQTDAREFYQVAC